MQTMSSRTKMKTINGDSLTPILIFRRLQGKHKFLLKVQPSMRVREGFPLSVRIQEKHIKVSGKKFRSIPIKQEKPMSIKVSSLLY